MSWIEVERPGQSGPRKAKLHAKWNTTYGKENWKRQWVWGDSYLDKEMAIQLYEDAYLHFFQNNPDKLEWLLNTASNVYDDAKSNMDSGTDYLKQETGQTHIQDISIRRVLIRMGTWFKGDHPVQIRGPETEGGHLDPGWVPFHMPERIRQPALKSWWMPNSIEDFYQSNKVILKRT